MSGMKREYEARQELLMLTGRDNPLLYSMMVDLCPIQTMRNEKARRKALKEVYESLGMVKVKGSLGGTYWE